MPCAFDAGGTCYCGKREGVSAFTQRTRELLSLVRCGATLLPSDLAAEDWDGLSILMMREGAARGIFGA
jgi:hypothetical protein